MPTSSDAVSQWDVIIVPFPYADQLSEKRRPALVISTDSFNSDTGLLWVLMITTSREEWPHDVPLHDLDKTGLPVPSKVRCAKVATIEANRVIRIAGKLSSKDRDAVKKVLKRCTVQGR